MSAKHLEPVFIGPGGSAGPILASHVGSKAAELARLSALRLPVPPAFVLPTSLCAGVIAGDEDAMKAMRNGVVAGIGWLEAATKRRLGDARSPLFVSVRSGAEKSMPGMLDTVLDVGMNALSVHGLIRMTGNPRMAYDSYRRFIQSYAEVVGGAAPGSFAGLLAKMIAAEGVGERGGARFRGARAADRRVSGARRTSRPRAAIRPDRPDRRGGAGGLQVMGKRPVEGVPAAQFADRPRRHGRHRPGDGVRQFGRRFGGGRRVLAQPGDGREGALRRLPRRRAGGGRRLGPALAERRGAASPAHARGRATARGGRSRARGRLPGRAGHRVHRRARAALVPADPHGQAHPARGPEDRRRSGR